MPILRPTQTALGEDLHLVELAREQEGARETATAEFRFRYSEEDQRDLRWYLEDYLQAPEDPTPHRARGSGGGHHPEVDRADSKEPPALRQGHLPPVPINTPAALAKRCGAGYHCAAFRGRDRASPALSPGHAGGERRLAPGPPQVLIEEGKQDGV
jgi:hypothetical protein